MVISDRIVVKTRGDGDVVDVTGETGSAITRSGLKGGVATLFVMGSTAGLSTVEYEPGLVADLKDAFERVAPRGREYAHNERWGDGNGHSHVRASLLGPSLSVPFQEGRPLLGTWQQIVLIDFDTRPRRRELVVQLMGE